MMKYWIYAILFLFSFNGVWSQDTTMNSLNVKANITVNSTAKVIVNNTIISNNSKLTVYAKTGFSFGIGSKVLSGSSLSVNINSGIIDNDADGMADSWETANSLTSPTADADNDGHSNLIEYNYSSNPNSITSIPNIALSANAPVALNDNVSTNQNTPVTFNPLTNDVDYDSDTLTIIAITNGAKGSVTFTTNSLTYTPISTAVGIDTFTYTITDGKGQTSFANVKVTIGSTGNYLLSFLANGVDGYISENANGYCVDFFFTSNQPKDRLLITYSLTANMNLFLDNVLQVSGKDIIDLNKDVSYVIKSTDNSISKNLIVKANVATFKMTSTSFVSGSVGTNINHTITTDSSSAVVIKVTNLPSGLTFNGVNNISGVVASATDVETLVTLTSNNQTIPAKIFFDFNPNNNPEFYQPIWQPSNQLTSGAWVTGNLTENRSVRGQVNQTYLSGYSKIRFKLRSDISSPTVIKGFAALAQTTGPSGTFIQHVAFGGVDYWDTYITIPANSELISDTVNITGLSANLLYTYHSTTTNALTYSGQGAYQGWTASGGWWNADWSGNGAAGYTSHFIVASVIGVSANSNENIDFSNFQINGISGVFLDTNNDSIKDSIFVNLPVGAVLTNLKPVFALNNSGYVLVDDVVQTSNVSTVDFSSIREFRVQSTINSSERKYFVKVTLGYVQVDNNFDDIDDLIGAMNISNTNLDHDSDALSNLFESFLYTDLFDNDTDKDTVLDTTDGFPKDPNYTQIPSGQSGDVVKPEITVTLPVNLTVVP